MSIRRAMLKDRMKKVSRERCEKVRGMAELMPAIIYWVIKIDYYLTERNKTGQESQNGERERERERDGMTGNNGLL